MNARVPTELGTEKISVLLRQYAVPAIIAMTASSLYNMVDAIFIGHGVGPYAISGLALTFPFMNLAAAFGTLVGVGASTMASMLLGQKNYDIARKVLGNVVVLNFIIGMAFTVVALVFLDPILYFFGASDQTISYARDYMQIILAGNVITHIYLGLNSLMRSAGHPKRAMSATIMTVLLNAALDPLFIFTFDMGIRGAAVATILAQVVALILTVVWFCDKRELIHFEKGIFRLDRRIVKDSIIIGLAPFLMNFVACFVVIIINMRLKTYGGDLAIGAYGIVNRIVFVFIMIVSGLTQGMQPIAGYNFGAKQMPRVYEVLKKTMIYSTVVLTTGFLICEICPRLVISIFTDDRELMDIAVHGMRLVVAMFPLVASSMVIGNFFQSIGKPRQAIFLSLSRQLIFLIPCLWLLPFFFGIAGVWSSFIVADALASVVSMILLINFIRHNRNHE
ncbi:MAG TPA: MATE family efflux transporter [Candidatus Coprenecus stercoripullorum]|nr:MATE family efflux transporter [Candidatus Coprenecus stercoripullorum]